MLLTDLAVRLGIDIEDVLSWSRFKVNHYVSYFQKKAELERIEWDRRQQESQMNASR